MNNLNYCQRHEVFIYLYILAFGSNLGNRERNCELGELGLLNYGVILRRSRLLYTEPLQRKGDPSAQNQAIFLNYIVEFRTSLSAAELYQRIARIEDAIGHDRDRKWAPRYLDIDILLVARDTAKPFKEALLYVKEEEGGLCIPHPEIKNRAFLVDLLTEDFSFSKDWLWSL